MESERLRALERQFRIRVKTGCTTCRIRRVKCDETKPECVRCTKTGRKCDGYTDAALSRKSTPAAAAAYRNSSFLSVPAASATAVLVPRSPSPGLFDTPAENRSFAYFKARTLPQWTEFFDSELWSRDILRMMFYEPAIKHGVLALSAIHELYNANSTSLITSPDDYAFKQYVGAVTHSNQLLAAHQAGKTSVETVLIACIIFVCYESLVGNYKVMAMHLGNGLRILKQNRHRLTRDADLQSGIEQVLHRFDFQSMSFSDGSSPYVFDVKAPALPKIPSAYTGATGARTDLVELLRSMMWMSNVTFGLESPGVPPEGPPPLEFLEGSRQLLSAFQAWTVALDAYCSSLSPSALRNPKTYAGITLLHIYAIVCQIVVTTSATNSETSYDKHFDDVKSILDMTATLPAFQVAGQSDSVSPYSITSPSHRASPATTPLPNTSHDTSFQAQLPTRVRPSVTPEKKSPDLSAGASIHQSVEQVSRDQRASCASNSSPSSIPPSSMAPLQHRTPPAFCPSFELSPIIPLFLIATHCRDPFLRRRAIELLLVSRRREGVWDSIGAAGVGAEVLKIEEGIVHEPFSTSAAISVPPLGWVTQASDIPEEARVREVCTTVSIAARTIRIKFVRYGPPIWKTIAF